jgi:hypothetical protein
MASHPSARYDEAQGRIVFSSGRHLFVQGGVVGIGPDLLIYEGPARRLAWPPEDYLPSGEHIEESDMIELVALIAARWALLAKSLASARQRGGGLD